jgi:hypothetical protein
MPGENLSTNDNLNGKPSPVDYISVQRSHRNIGTGLSEFQPKASLSRFPKPSGVPLSYTTYGLCGYPLAGSIGH